MIQHTCGEENEENSNGVGVSLRSQAKIWPT